MKKDTWVVVANSSSAHIYKVEDNQLVSEISHAEHPESRLHEGDLVTSKPGRQQDSVGSNQHSYESETSPKKQEFKNFAQELANLLERAREDGKVGKLYIAAGPAFLGMLRPALSSTTSQLVAAEVDKDLTHAKLDDIRAHFPDIL